MTVGRRIREIEESFGGRQEFLCREVGVACAREAEALAAGAQRLRVAASVRKVIAECGLTASSAPYSLADDMRSHITSIASVAIDDTLKGVIALLDEAWPGGFVDGVTVTDAPLSALLARCEEALAALPRLQEWMALQHCLRRCRELGAMGFLEALGPVTARAARSAFERRFYTAWANAALEVSPALAVFAGSRLEQQIARFRVLDGELRNAALSRTRATARAPARRVASAQGGVGTASEVGILRRELEKRKRIKPLRRLFAEIPTVLQALKPCMLMSPLSVSTFLKPGAVTFDLVIFDEASQLRTPEGIPAILRAKQVVVAGDSKQLPPTSFFTASIIGDDDGAEGNNGEELEPLESLLDDCVEFFHVFVKAYLRWHYRSSDERMIKFSNHYFYRDRPLITFPPPSLGMSTATFTEVHVVVSLIGIVSGVIVVVGMLSARRLPGWTALCLITTVLTSVTVSPASTCRRPMSSPCTSGTSLPMPSAGRSCHSPRPSPPATRRTTSRMASLRRFASAGW